MTRMDELTARAGRVARDLWLRGWAERNAGNFSYRLSPEDLSGIQLVQGTWYELGTQLPEVAGQRFLVSATGSFFRVMQHYPQQDLGVIEIDQEGRRHRTLWGYLDGRSPTSELPSHLRAHGACLRRGEEEERAVVHTHPTHLIALSNALPLTTGTLSRLLWGMHAECIIFFPDGCGVLDWHLPGSEELARATAEVLKRRRLVLWPHHGAVAMGTDLETAFGLLETADKAAEIYLKAASQGPVTRVIQEAQLLALAEDFGVQPDMEILQGGE